MIDEKLFGNCSMPEFVGVGKLDTIGLIVPSVEETLKTAANIPYNATLKALTTLRGKIFPIKTPKKVPMVHPGAAMEITP